MTDLSVHRYGIGKTISKTNILNLGITFVGACGTRTCNAYEKCVCCKLSKGGYGKFDLAKDSCDCVYPSCEKPMKTLETCYFNKCKWEYTGMVQQPSAGEFEPSKEYVKKEGSGMANAKNGYFKYTGDLVNWRFLEFNVEEIPEEELVDL